MDIYTEATSELTEQTRNLGVNLADERIGAKALSCSDDFFASAQRMLNHLPARFYPERYDDNGKWMDGWESRRRRDNGHDWCIVELGVAGIINAIQVDTHFFTGNFAPAVKVQGANGDQPPAADSDQWQPLLATHSLSGNSEQLFEVSSEQQFRFLKVSIFPDGGISRLKVFGKPCVSHTPGQQIDLIALQNGGQGLAYNDSHYGHPNNLLSPGDAANMGDGWETRRRREPGNDWCIIALGQKGIAEAIEVYTTHFKGNFPPEVSIQAACLEHSDIDLVPQSLYWQELLPKQALAADGQFRFEELASLGPITHLKINIYPDGGLARVRLWGQPEA